MINQRDPSVRSTPASHQKFVAGAGDENVRTNDPDAPRKHMSLTIPFNQYEWELLEQGCDTERRSKASLLRLAMIEYVQTRVHG